MKVFKTSIPIDDKWHPMGTRKGVPDILHVGSQGDPQSVQLWFRHEDVPRDELKRFEVRVFGTGQDVPNVANHVGTTLVAGGLLVWHVFAVEVK